MYLVQRTVFLVLIFGAVISVLHDLFCPEFLMFCHSHIVHLCLCE